MRPRAYLIEILRPSPSYGSSPRTSPEIMAIPLKIVVSLVALCGSSALVFRSIPLYHKKRRESLLCTAIAYITAQVVILATHYYVSLAVYLSSKHVSLTRSQIKRENDQTVLKFMRPLPQWCATLASIMLASIAPPVSGTR
ncbi:hypothetical protein Agabi119p4_3280 [Agaricus bisporus var. burnettii]|uniref:Uncharacterized protein n=1 Tax=Agaricus bisporus var. burnettii TaxID=192524 RepID=A0A8H7F769_AGABI|nr:hypothetical protein Agabi119p4_3280 [Agaricus bisporus var. burnettii]